MTVQECYEAFGGNYAEVIGRLRTDERVTKFLMRIPGDACLALLDESMKSRNMEEAFRAAHTLKGICMNLAITKLLGSAEKLTEALRGRKEYGDDLVPLYECVQKDLAQTVSCIQKLD